MNLIDFPLATDGEIAIHNHEGVLDRCWHVILQQPDRKGSLEQLIDEENKRIQFLGDLGALDRLKLLAAELLKSRPHDPQTYIVAAQVSSAAHLFAEARHYLSQARALAGEEDQISRIELTINQATWEQIPEVLKKRQDNAERSQDLSDFVPLGALQADIGLYEQAQHSYLKALASYKDLSPFPLAWTCFQLGMLWVELMPEPDLNSAATWYSQAIKYLPQYVHARVHLSEIYLEWGRLDDALSLLEPIADVQDPEINWRKGQILEAQNKSEEARICFAKADLLYQSLLMSHKAAFADHATEYYLSSGANPGLAFELASFNYASRPTLRAFNLFHEAGSLATNNQLHSQEISEMLRFKWKDFPNAEAYHFENTTLN